MGTTLCSGHYYTKHIAHLQAIYSGRGKLDRREKDHGQLDQASEPRPCRLSRAIEPGARSAWDGARVVAEASICEFLIYGNSIPDENISFRNVVHGIDFLSKEYYIIL